MSKNPKVDEMLAANAVPINTIASPGLHPTALTPFAEPLIGHDAARPALDAGMKALRTLYSAITDMTNAENAVRERFGGSLVVDGKTIRQEIPEERRAELSSLLSQKFESVARNFDHQLQTVEEVVSTLDARIEKALVHPKKDTPSVAQAASDIRNYVRGLPDEKRMNFLHGAIRDGDHEVASAVLGSTPWVSGLNRESAAVVRSLSEERFAKADYDARAAARKVADHVKASAKNFTAAYCKLVPTIKPSKVAAAVAKLKESA